MSRIILPCYDASFALGKQSGNINGGTAYFWHLAHNFQALGHEAQVVNNGDPLPPADVIIIQSEWYAIQGQMDAIKTMRANGAKVVVLLGHFKGGVYYDPNLIDADLFISTWKGEVVDNFKQEVKFFSHGFCTICDKPGSERKGDIVWVGNKYPLRNEDWFDGLPVTKVQGLMPDELGKIYRGAQICPNLHGDFQKGIVSHEPSRLADVPGFAVNERLFQITGSGGFQIADNNPQIKEFFEDDELVTATDVEDFKTKIQFFLDNPQEKESYIENGKRKIMLEHTYEIRCKQLLKWIEELY